MLLQLGLATLSTTVVLSAAPDGGVAVADSATASSAEDSVVISTREQLLPGSQAQSPGTSELTLADLRNRRAASSESGSAGLMHLSSASVGNGGLFRISGLAQYLRGNNFPLSGLTDANTAVGFTAGWVVDEHLETFLSYASATYRRRPNALAASDVSDLTFNQGSSLFQGGLKLVTSLSPRWFVGAEFAGSAGDRSGARTFWTFSPRAVATYDARGDVRVLPALLHVNAGAAFQTKGAEALAGHPFAAGQGSFDRAYAGLGLETPLPWVTPFLEYAIAYPLRANGLISVSGESLRAGRAMPQAITLGGRLTALSHLTLTLAVDFGLNRVVASGFAPAAPLNFILAAEVNTGFADRPEIRWVETVREPRRSSAVAQVTHGQVTGMVLDGATRRPIGGAMVTVVGSGLPPVATDPDSGRFLTQTLPSGNYSLAVAKEGYRTVATEARVETAHLTEIEVLVEHLPRQALFTVSASSKGKPVAALVSFAGDAQHTLTLSATGKGRLDLPPGQYEVSVSAPGLLAQTREVQVSAGADMSLAFDLAPEPSKKLVVLKNDRIEILQQVHFATGKADILMDSYSLLNQVVDAIVRNNIRRIRIEGHTDNRGSKIFNQRLSEQRARAVADYLLRAGIDRNRIETIGYGDSRPIAPNLNARGREFNRRVEFFILGGRSKAAER